MILYSFLFQFQFKYALHFLFGNLGTSDIHPAVYRNGVGRNDFPADSLIFNEIIGAEFSPRTRRAGIHSSTGTMIPPKYSGFP